MAKKKPTRLEDARARMYHDLIFEAAECVFGAKGFERTTMQDIAAEAGVSLKTLYAAFEGKQELYEEIMKVRGTAFVGHVHDEMAAVDDPFGRIEAATRAYVEFLFEHKDWLRIHLRNRLAFSIRPKEKVSARTWMQGLSDYADTLRMGMAEGVFYDGDPDELAVLTQSLLQTHVSRCIEAGETDPEPVVQGILVHLRRLLCKPQPD